jgi:hypothetical protein
VTECLKAGIVESVRKCQFQATDRGVSIVMTSQTVSFL